ncbi:hypothetical protein [Flavisolibacter ginsenosidimutans]|uniref:DUF1080 domain-containing protein n=1 Tax=Flavisolibacter ginsenosidimutans TaxID=661481 RepID=A0A5B8UKT7_9BACT|nr:hypothetical protein [Flavisolibacter ginsenosidimutans]QEC57294.1 hypothetical protein FSB75_15775 [Flavisolibacter ginsenosidimutans]
MLRTTLLTLLLTSFFTTSVFSQKILLEDDFNDNRNGWRLQHDSSFFVDIKDGVLHIEKFEKNFISRGCLWYNKIIPGLNTLNNFSITLYAKFLHGDDVADVIDLQWGENQRMADGRVASSLYQLTLMLRSKVKLELFNLKWTYITEEELPSEWMTTFNPRQLNKYELVQKDSILTFRINDQEVLKQLYTPIAGNSIGIQQCLKAAWEIDKIVIRQDIATPKPAPEVVKN